MPNRQPHSFFQSHSGAATDTEEEDSPVIAPTTEDETHEERGVPMYPHLHHPSRSHSPSPSILDGASPPPLPQTASLLSSSSSLTIETVAEDVSMLLDGESTTTEQPPSSPRLPSGHEIDAKNTCQSHSVIVVTEFNTTAPATAAATEVEQSRPLPASHSILRTTTMGIGTYQTTMPEDITPSTTNKNHQTNKNFGPNTGSVSTILSIRSPSPNDNVTQYLQSSTLSTHPPAATSSSNIPTNGYKSGLMTRTTRNNIPTDIHGFVASITPQREDSTAAAFVTPDTDTISSEIINTLHSVTIAPQPPPFATARLLVPAVSNPRLRPIQLEQPVVQVDTATDIVPRNERFSARKPLCVWMVMFSLLVSFSVVIVPTVYCTVRQSCTEGRRRPRPPTTIATDLNPDGTSTTANYDHVRRAAVINFINNITHTGLIIALPNATSSDTTADGKPWLSGEKWALHWLIDLDPLQLIPNTTMFRIRIVQRYALLTLWFQQEVQFQWNKTDNWASVENECLWYGIHCEEWNVDGISFNVVTKVHLPYNNIVGSMSPDLGLLSTLRYWNMSGNWLKGEIPQSLPVSWKHIEYFEMSPGEYETYSTEDGVSLETGFHDAAISWKNIKYFAFRNYALSSLPSSLNQWSNIEHFDVSGGTSSGTIPDGMRAWSRLTSLTLAGHSFFEGSLPSWIGEWTNLETFDVSGCLLTGTIPPSVGNWSNIRSVIIANTHLNGTLPSSVGQWTKLQNLDMGLDIIPTLAQFTGTLPSGIANWSELRLFNIRNHAFSGPLPQLLSQWTDVTVVDFSNNRFTGSLPQSLDQWIHVTSAYFSNNRITGPLPPSIGQWTAIESVDFSVNLFNGSIPKSVGQWTAIESVDFSVNLFNGSIPQSIDQWTNVLFADFQNNTLHGTIPMSIGRCSRLAHFDVSHNSLTGTIPGSIGNWTYIITVSMSKNRLNGTLPDSMKHWSMIDDVDFGSNSLTGTLPSSIGLWRSLKSLRVDNNQLYGQIPISVANWRHFLYGDFHGNNFTGSIPIELCTVEHVPDDIFTGDGFTSVHVEPVLNITWLVADCAHKVLCDCCTRCL